MLPVLDHEETRSKGSYQNQRPYPQTGKYGDSIDVVSPDAAGANPSACPRQRKGSIWIRAPIYETGERERERRKTGGEQSKKRVPHPRRAVPPLPRRGSPPSSSSLFSLPLPHATTTTHTPLHCTNRAHPASIAFPRSPPVEASFLPFRGILSEEAGARAPRSTHGVGDAPVELGRRVEQRVVGRGGGGRGGRGGAGRLGGAPERDGRAGAGGRGAAEAAAAGDQGARQVRRRATRGPRLPHCHVR